MPGQVINRQHNPGTYSGYNWHMERRNDIGKDGRKLGKRHKICKACMNANTSQQDTYRKKVYLNGGLLRRPACGARRRLQALAAMGWNFKEIGKKFGKDPSFLSNLSNTRNKSQVYPETIEKITAIYDEFSGFPPPEDWLHKRTASQARQRGYLGPLSWDDEVLDDPYALPTELTHVQAYIWFWNAASDIERIEWVLEHGLAVTRADRANLSRSQRAQQSATPAAMANRKWRSKPENREKENERKRAARAAKKEAVPS